MREGNMVNGQAACKNHDATLESTSKQSLLLFFLFVAIMGKYTFL